MAGRRLASWLSPTTVSRPGFQAVPFSLACFSNLAQRVLKVCIPRRALIECAHPGPHPPPFTLPARSTWWHHGFLLKALFPAGPSQRSQARAFSIGGVSFGSQSRAFLSPPPCHIPCTLDSPVLFETSFRIRSSSCAFRLGARLAPEVARISAISVA